MYDLTSEEKKNDVLLYRNKFKVSISANLNVLKIDGEKRKPNTIIKVVLKSLIVSSGATKREHSKVIYSHIDFFFFYSGIVWDQWIADDILPAVFIIIIIIT